MTYMKKYPWAYLVKTRNQREHRGWIRYMYEAYPPTIQCDCVCDYPFEDPFKPIYFDAWSNAVRADFFLKRGAMDMEKRYKSFDSFDHEGSAIIYAMDGFYHPGEDRGKTAACYYCELRIPFTQEFHRQDIYQLHEKKRPDCDFVRATRMAI
jgi:hypothetical protein